MDTGYGLADLLSFLDYLADKGMLNRNTAVARKAASNKMFGVLDEDEQADLRDTDLESVSVRFANLRGQGYKPESLQVYKSRAGAALSDFLRYKDNPATFKIESIGARTIAKASGAARSKVAATGQRVSPKDQESEQPIRRIPSIDIPIPLRPNCIVQINGIPVDLKPTEAKKIAAVVSAMVEVEE